MGGGLPLGHGGETPAYPSSLHQYRHRQLYRHCEVGQRPPGPPGLFRGQPLYWQQGGGWFSGRAQLSLGADRSSRAGVGRQCGHTGAEHQPSASCTSAFSQPGLPSTAGKSWFGEAGAQRFGPPGCCGPEGQWLEQSLVPHPLSVGTQPPLLGMSPSLVITVLSDTYVVLPVSPGRS